jgi:hypothetical protein
MSPLPDIFQTGSSSRTIYEGNNKMKVLCNLRSNMKQEARSPKDFQISSCSNEKKNYQK